MAAKRQHLRPVRAPGMEMLGMGLAAGIGAGLLNRFLPSPPVPGIQIEISSAMVREPVSIKMPGLSISIVSPAEDEPRQPVRSDPIEPCPHITKKK